MGGGHAGYEVGVLMNGTSALTEGTPESSWALLPCEGTRRGDAGSEPGRGPPASRARTNHCFLPASSIQCCLTTTKEYSTKIDFKVLFSTGTMKIIFSPQTFSFKVGTCFICEQMKRKLARHGCQAWSAHSRASPPPGSWNCLNGSGRPLIL